MFYKIHVEQFKQYNSYPFLFSTFELKAVQYFSQEKIVRVIVRKSKKSSKTKNLLNITIFVKQ